MADEALEPPLGRTLRDGRYTLLRVLGQGSQGRTWEATDHRTGQTVAVKEFDVHGARAWKDVELAEREARVLAKLAHPLLPAYVEHFEEGEALYLVMEKVEGTPLSVLQKSGGLSEREVRRLLADADLALSYLHAWSPPVIHRDLKPGNILRRPDASFAFVDFGAVRDRLQPEGGSTTVGTFGFMAPEQFQGRAGPASDVYSVAATAVAMLTGLDPDKLPHRGLAVDVEKALGGRASRELVAALSRMLELDPDARPTRIAPLLDAPPRPAATPRRGAERWLAVGAVALLATLFVGWVGVRRLRQAPEPPVLLPVAPTPAFPVTPQPPPPPEKPRAPEPMVKVPGGTFKMRGEDTTVAPFAMDATEVTAADFRACVEAGRCKWGGDMGNYRWAARAQFAMNYVTWGEADAYCKAGGKRLPTEEEWEWAVRGQDEGRKYPWGDAEPTDQVCRVGCGGCAVTEFSRGDARGGIHGLASEAWTSSPAGKSAHVIRGWSWEGNRPISPGTRVLGDQDRFCDVTFRCVESAAAPPTPDLAPVELRWKGRLTASTGAAPAAGTPCTLATVMEPIPGHTKSVELQRMTLTCAGATLYDSSLPLNGMSSNSFDLDERAVGGATETFQYLVTSDDLGARSGQKAQITLSSPLGVCEAFRDVAPSFRVRVALDRLSAVRHGPRLLPAPAK
jgi:hypothetical protein